jgi:hypothetical protein
MKEEDQDNLTRWFVVGSDWNNEHSILLRSHNINQRSAESVHFNREIDCSCLWRIPVKKSIPLMFPSNFFNYWFDPTDLLSSRNGLKSFKTKKKKKKNSQNKRMSVNLRFQKELESLVTICNRY